MIENNTSDSQTSDTNHAQAPANQNRVPFLPLRVWYGLLALVFLLVLSLGIFTLLTLRAMPGDRLYSAKTTIVEPAFGLLHQTPRSRAAYSISLLETRLSELEKLQRDGATTTPETLGAFTDLVNQEVDRADDSLAGLRASAPEEALDLHLKIVSVADAHQTVSRAHDEFSSAEEGFEDARGRAFDALKAAVYTFASTTPDAASARIGKELTALEGEMPKVAHGSEAENRALERLDDAEDAIRSGQIGDALLFILRARQAIAVDGYLYDSERGPQEGQATAPPVPTEGQ